MNIPNLEELSVESRERLERELAIDAPICTDCGQEIGLRELYARDGVTLLCVDCLEQRAEQAVHRLTGELRSASAALKAIQSVRQAHV